MENTAGPTIFRSTVPSSDAPKKSSGWLKGNIIKIALVLLILAVLAEVVFGAFTLFSPNTVRNLNILQPKINEMKGAQLSLVAERGSYKKGETVVIDVRVYTGGYSTYSTDVVIKYDPAFLKPQDPNFASVGQIYTEYPPIQIDSTNGLIGISGITNPNQPGFSGVGDFARLNFTALKDGQTPVDIDFEPSLTADSNVVLSGSTKDLLTSVHNTTINISAGEVSDNKASAEKCESFTQYCQSDSGKVGTQVCKAGTIIEGSCGYDPSLTVSCGECKI